MWVGTISAAATAPAGSYDLQVFGLDKPREDPVAAYRAIVYPDYAALRASYLSFIRRTLDITPGAVALALIPALGVVMGLMLLLGRRVERLLAGQGRAEVFMVKAAPGGYAVYFGLGRRHGVEEGMAVRIVTDAGRPIATAVVRHVDEDNAMALAGEEAQILPHGAVVVLGGEEADRMD
jgi:hypothetical protein